MSSLPPTTTQTPRWLTILGLVLTVGVLVYFYGVAPAWGPTRASSALYALQDSWNAETDYEHGWLYPIIIVGLIVYQWKDLRASVSKGNWLGIIPILIGAVFFLISYRTIQWRVAIGSLPFILFGSAWYLWGRKTALLLAFPFFFLWLSIPLPQMQQATIKLQTLATQCAHLGSKVCGVDSYVQGTEIFSSANKWEPLSIAGGCSGIRSLMALIMISATWAYVARMALWKKCVLFLSAIPLAIIGNALRVTSIFVIAEYGNAEWARKQWHDWSGLLLFYPISLALMLFLHSVLDGGLPWRKSRRVTRRVVQRQATPTTSES